MSPNPRTKPLTYETFLNEEVGDLNLTSLLTNYGGDSSLAEASLRTSADSGI